ncbi:hypothetical protein HDF26_002344 [Pedobacter cryoconitis]|uniref:hypothetical protein n=1 Tax=Pedobacter cryoconitis TaxID=188932 RepID=UPI001613F4E2|nr:hypothetical protein [Pedobacter cryoconitis]MBB6271887.1 hypothetical protein [Pedobacter cryoconitis]
MEPFDIQLLESHLRIEPLDNGLYRVMEEGNKLGVIYAEANGDQVVWDTQDELEKDFVQQIGELITEHNM